MLIGAAAKGIEHMKLRARGGRAWSESAGRWRSGARGSRRVHKGAGASGRPARASLLIAARGGVRIAACGTVED